MSSKYTRSPSIPTEVKRCARCGVPLGRRGHADLCQRCKLPARVERQRGLTPLQPPAPPEPMTHTVTLEQQGVKPIAGSCQWRPRKPAKAAVTELTRVQIVTAGLIAQEKHGIGRWPKECPNRAVVEHDGSRYCEAHARSLGLSVPAYLSRKGLIQLD